MIDPPTSCLTLQTNLSVSHSMGRSTCTHSELPIPTRTSGGHMTAISNMFAQWMNQKGLSFTGVTHVSSRGKTEKRLVTPNPPTHPTPSLGQIDHGALLNLVLFVCTCLKGQDNLIIGYFCNLARTAQYLFGICLHSPIPWEMENNNRCFIFSYTMPYN